METRIHENQLILPALLVLHNSESGKASTSELIKKLRILLNPKGEDVKILKGRKDDKFSQKVRNLKSHSSLEKDHYAKYQKSIFSITQKGENYLNEKFELIRYLITNDFDWGDIKDSLKAIDKNKKKKVETFDENILINEGYKKALEVSFYARSKTLRDAAIKFFTTKGLMYCQCCRFSFSNFYGEKFGKGYIEIHHIKPVFKYEDDELQKFISDAIENLIPVCSNCHRMIHRNWKHPIDIDVLRQEVVKFGHFSSKH